MERSTGSGLSFVKRMYLPRSIGLGIGFFCVAAGIWPLQPAPWVWGLLVFNGFLWPHLAFLIASRAAEPFDAERRNLLLDSLCGGLWAATMQFNALPTVTILAMMAMNNIAAGGGRFFSKGCLAMFAGMCLAWLLFGLAFNPDTSMSQLYASLPMLILYPLALGWVSYKLSITLAEHKQALRTASRTDSLTRLFSHGHWKDLLYREFERCRGGQQRATVALIDVDHFKQINDRHGHLVGDSVLRLLSERLVCNLRNGDLAGRYGGDEFCVILPNTPPILACEVMERLRQELGAVHSELAPELRISLSIGLAGYSPFQLDASHWLKDAEQALHLAKDRGRDQVVIASESTALANDQQQTHLNA